MAQHLELPLLNIDSQAQLISRLQFLSRFASNFIHVSGGTGAGKTQIAQQYLEYSESNQNCALVSCRPNQKDSTIRTMILQQIFSEPLFDAEDKLLDSFERMQGSERCDVVIAIDDAHCLSFDLFSELWSLVQETTIRSAWKINVILFAQSELLKRYISQIEQVEDSKIVEMDIAPLTLSESEQFLGSMQAIGELGDESLQYFQEEMTLRGFGPGEILEMAKNFEFKGNIEESPENIEEKPKKKSRKGSILTLILLALIGAIGSAYWWMPDDMQNQASKILHQIFDEPKEEQVANSGTAILASKEGVKLTDLMDKKETISPAELPKPINNDGVTLKTPDSTEKEQRIVVSSEVVDTLIEKEEPKQPEQNGATVIATGDENPVSENKDDQVVSVEKENVKVEQDAPAPPAPTNVESFINIKQLLARDSGHYTLQFAAAADLTTAIEFIETTKVESKDMLVYRAKHNNELWYIFVSGDYPNMEQARRAIVTLPQTLQDAKPWVKSYRKVQEEINNAK